MTEQLEDGFWAAARAQDTAARGQDADAGACGSCRDRVTAGRQVEHDECAQRATLLPAPDAPGYELITGLSEEELAALPPRFHVPAFMESSTPKMWVCAVCWGDGWVTGWPCKTAVKHGLRVFTPEHDAETAAKRQAAELEHIHKDRDTFRDQRNAVFKTNQRLTREVEAAGQARLPAENQTRTVTRTAEQLRARVAELEAERAKYVGKKPTIAEEMAYLSRCIDTVLDQCARAEEQAGRWEQPLPVPEWVAEVRKAAGGLVERTTYPPALPWAALMDAEDLAEFLAELEHAAATPGATPTEALAAVEKACGTYRVIAETKHAHNTAAGPNTEAGEG
ncbi:hypothetical protein [Streptomyces sp. NPDC006510]|uniref:hypothetical protein n=1 Tax=unclassified Streptomyces TaxID=2593676 RepID=UPI0033A9BF07|nr:hypothetical protein OG355_41430 [Streptomyces sp. NBC_00987]